jgi:sugar/nucleoside kinase (ribokinase family)
MVTVVIAPLGLDRVMRVERIPDLDERAKATEPLEESVGSMGKRRSDVQKSFGWECRICGRVSDDPAGATIRSLLDAAGLSTEWLINIPGKKSATSSIWIAKDERKPRVISDDGTVGAISMEDLDLHLLDDVDVVQIEGRNSHAVLDLAWQAKRRGKFLVVDLGNRMRDKKLGDDGPGMDRREILECSPNVVQLSDDGAKAYAEEWALVTNSPSYVAHDIYHRYGCDLVVVTDGDNGSWHAPKKRNNGYTPAYEIDASRTGGLGGGDYFGGFLTVGMAWKLMGISDLDVADIVQRAAAGTAGILSGELLASEISESQIRAFAERTAIRQPKIPKRNGSSIERYFGL